MTPSKINRYCAPPHVLRLLARDGIGWGHDLDCGAFVGRAVPQRRRGW